MICECVNSIRLEMIKTDLDTNKQSTCLLLSTKPSAKGLLVGLPLLCMFAQEPGATFNACGRHSH